MKIEEAKIWLKPKLQKFSFIRVNGWHNFDLNGSKGVTAYPAKFLMEEPERPDLFFRKMAPGAEE
jgi:hypothetical protein